MLRPNAFVSGLAPYKPGAPLSSLQHGKRAIKMASNENAFGPSPHVIAALQAAPCVFRYPEVRSPRLRTLLAAYWGCSEESFVFGNGSNDVVDVLFRTYLNPEREVVASQYAFQIYPQLTHIAGGVYREVPAKQFGHDIDAIIQAVSPKTAFVVLVNPNNPTGTWITEQDVRRVLDAVSQDTVVLLDEAYIEYVDAAHQINTALLLKQYPNFLVARTFSKAYALASLRCGYLVGNPELIAPIACARQPFSVNCIAATMAAIAFEDTVHLKDTVAKTVALRHAFEAFLKQLNLDVIPSQTNFVTCRHPKGGAWLESALKTEGILVRACEDYGMPEWVRITIGTEVDQAELKQVLQSLVT